MKRNIERQMLKYLLTTMFMTSVFVIITMLISVGGSALNLLQSNQSAIIRGLQSLHEMKEQDNILRLQVANLTERMEEISACVMQKKTYDRLTHCR